MVLVFLCTCSARAQEPVPLEGQDESAAAELRKKAIDLLESVVGQVDILRSGENRARIRSNAADLLWKHDEKRARGLFAAVEEDIKAGLNDSDPDPATRSHTLAVFMLLRSDTIGRIARHDPALALSFLRATRPASIEQFPHQLRQGEEFMELRLAGQIAARDPRLALKLGRESLSKGFSTDILSVLAQLQGKDNDGWLAFYKEIVDKLKAANLAQDSAAAETATGLAQSFPPSGANEQVYRELLGILLTSALDNGCGNPPQQNAPHYLCIQVGLFFSRMEFYYGSRVAPLKRYAEVGQHFFSPPISAQVTGVIENGSVDEILALAPKHPELRQQVYWKAMMKAEASGDVARARQIAADVPDEEQRRYMLAQIERNQVWKTVSAEKLAAIQQELSRLRTNEDRVDFLLDRAHRIGVNDRKAALSLLNQASQILDSSRFGTTQLGGQVMLAMLYCSLKSDRGFSIMETMIPKLNALVTAAAALDGFENNYLRDGEWNMSRDGAVGDILNGLSENAGYFASMDFDRSVSLASQFERPELRLMAGLKLAQSVLAPRTNPSLFRIR